MNRVRGGGCLGALVLLAGAAIGAWIGLYPFLARHDPVRSDLLVVEGWLKDEMLLQAAGWAESNGVKKIVATGGPIEMGSYLAEWKTHAEMTKARMEAMGLGAKFELAAAPAEKVRRGRTREAARGLRAALGMERGSFNLASEGPHVRRSWRAFQDEFGDGVEVGSVALAPSEYGRDDWWSCSEGVRSVVDETVAYVYDLIPGRTP
ncbi:MAG: cytosine deaminase [Kiritimatiellia bacterium]